MIHDHALRRFCVKVKLANAHEHTRIYYIINAVNLPQARLGHPLSMARRVA